MAYVFFAILTIVSFFFGWCCKKAQNQSAETTPAQGKILRVIRGETGHKRYDVEVVLPNGAALECQSIFYTNTQNKYHQGDAVAVRYYFSDKGKGRCEIDDETLVPCTSAFAGAAKVFYIASGISFCLFLISLLVFFIA